MSQGLITHQTLTDIADAIRTKLGVNTTYTPPQMAPAVLSIPTVKIVQFATGTDAEIGDMLDAAYAGDINLSDYWSIGDTRVIHVDAWESRFSHAASDLTIVISSFADYMSCGCVMQFDFINFDTAVENMNNTNTNSGGYGSSRMKTSALPTMAEALPTWMKDRMLTFDVLASAGARSSSIVTVSGNKLALRSVEEILGYADGSFTGEGSQIPYYTTAANRAKKDTGNNGRVWWLRSPYAYNNEAFCTINAAGGRDAATASTGNTYVAPFGCLGGKPALEIVPFSTGTDEQIVAMIQAAHNGDIDLQTDGGWAVGDTRTITVDAFTAGDGSSVAQQNVDMVITSFDDYNSCGCVMQFDFKDCLSRRLRMNSSDTNVGGYGSSEMYSTTLPALVNALPSWLKNLLVEFSVLASEGNSSSTIETITGNKLALRSVVEITGTHSYSATGEGVQLSYYSTASNRIKKEGTSGSAVTWRTRSPMTSFNSQWCNINTSGAETYGGANVDAGISPFGCL